MDVRSAANSDEAHLFEIHRTVFSSHIDQIWGWDEAWQRSNFTRELASSTTSVIWNKTQIVGYVQFHDEGDHLYLQNIALLPEFQKKGIGSQLIKELQAKASTRGIPLGLSVFRTNTPAQKLYERLGFERTGDTETHTKMSWRIV